MLKGFKFDLQRFANIYYNFVAGRLSGGYYGSTSTGTFGSFTPYSFYYKGFYFFAFSSRVLYLLDDNRLFETYTTLCVHFNNNTFVGFTSFNNMKFCGNGTVFSNTENNYPKNWILGLCSSYMLSTSAYTGFHNTVYRYYLNSSYRDYSNGKTHCFKEPDNDAFYGECTLEKSRDTNGALNDHSKNIADSVNYFSNNFETLFKNAADNTYIEGKKYGSLLQNIKNALVNSDLLPSDGVLLTGNFTTPTGNETFYYKVTKELSVLDRTSNYWNVVNYV